tara:strand:- start:11998 stop:12693 length:696 start_codon:yes stop_codon:yes gene_type:complete
MTTSKESFLDGEVILIDKPLKWTSFQVVNKIRWLIKSTYGIKKIKVGHAGTLDPLATGLLIICTGKMTKSIEKFMGQEKEYKGVFSIGATTPSYDLETEINASFPIDHINDEILKNKLSEFTGTIDQKPPIFSALKKNGKRLYKFAREGKEFEIPPRKVNVSCFELTKVKMPNLEFRICCSKGTYIRSLANDYGKALKSGAYLHELRRTRIGNHKIDDAMSIENFDKLLQK